jgi:hypothetical protein
VTDNSDADLVEHGYVRRVSTGHTGTIKTGVLDGYVYVVWDEGGGHSVSLADLEPATPNELRTR